MKQSVEEGIIELMRLKDKTFISHVYDHYAHNLFGVIKVIMKDEMLAQDVLQESFLKIWRNSDSFDPQKSRLFTWLLTICRNTAIDKVRSREKVREREIRMEDSNVYSNEEIELKPQLMDIKHLMGNLDEKYRVVLNALFFEGMTHIEASEALDVPLGTIKSRLKIGLRQMKSMFGDARVLITLIMIYL